MKLLTLILLSQLATPPRQVFPVLEFPEPGLDDTAAYQGYQTRFFRDVAGNTVQIYLDGRSGRAVHLLANADNESAGFTARQPNGRPATLRWASGYAEVFHSGGHRVIEYRLTANAPHVHLGWFLLGSMRVERDFQYAERHRAPFAGPPFTLPEVDRLVASLERLEPAERRRHLALLAAPDMRTLRARLQPTLTTRRTDSSWVAQVVQLSLDGRDTVALEIGTDPRVVNAARVGDSISLRARSGQGVTFTIRVATTAAPLTPLTRDEIFNPEFLTFLAAARADSTTLRARWLERQVRGVELLSSREKLMAGLPAYATYFGRDMLVSALMMRPIWRDEMSEFVVASVLRKLSPEGEVSHEEALGGQAVREAANEYASLVDEHIRAVRSGDRASATELLGRARDLLRDHRRVRENYHMIDDELQLPVLVARWLSDTGVPAERKRAFLADSADGGTRLVRLLRELALVARMTAAYAANPIAANLVSFPARDSARWASASWRDSNAGYAAGRYGMDVNTIWAPHALESIARILETFRALNVPLDSLARAMPELRAGTPLGTYVRDPASLRRATDAWSGAFRHFLVKVDSGQVRSHVAARLAALPAEERDHWAATLARTKADGDSLVFLAIALDAEGSPIGVANTDPATRLFLGEVAGAPAISDDVMRDVRLFVRAYPVGLFIDRVGPVVANDAYASDPVWQAFERDRYHGPRVAWGREVNLFLLGVADRIATAERIPANTIRVREMRAALARVLEAVEGSGFRSELWSYEVREGRLVPVRYGTGSDVQLWSTTDLAVQYALSRLNR